MNHAPLVTQSDELTRLEILRAYKEHYGRNGQGSHSPFEDRVVRYDSYVEPYDVIEIHNGAREAVKKIIHDIHQGDPSQVVILSGDPGMGKSHLLNAFRSKRLADELDYILICNSNHWKASEFEEQLLEWLINALAGPSPFKPHLLLERIEDLAFLALQHILAEPGLIGRYQARNASGLLRRWLSKFSGHDIGRFHVAVQRRDPSVFRLIEFKKFADFLCGRFLHESGNPFHRYVLQVLLRYLFEEEREIALHWLRRRPVHDYFLKRLGAEDRIDFNYKVIDTIKILISLFTPEVTRNLAAPGTSGLRDKVFFFAFDQMEGRQELFESETDWFKFFAQLSELYNSLPNVFILFTMTFGLRNNLYSRMEQQFQQRIRRDQKFVLARIEDSEALAVYQGRIDHWLRDAPHKLQALAADPRFRYLPFDQAQLLEMGRQKTLRAMLEEFHQRFCEFLHREVTLQDPRLEYLVKLNDLKREETEDNVNEFTYTEEHLEFVEEFLAKCKDLVSAAYGVQLSGLKREKTEDGLRLLWFEFRSTQHEGLWVRTWLARLPYNYNKWLNGCLSLLQNLHRKRNFVVMIRPERAYKAWEELRPGQVFARVLPVSTQTSLRAMLHLVEKRERYERDHWAKAEQVLVEELKLTYLGEMLQHAAYALEELQDHRDDGSEEVPSSGE